MDKVRAKKYLGQHFLKDENIARKIGESLVNPEQYDGILEIGPGMGVMTKYVLEKYPDHDFKMIELDGESVEYLNKHYPKLEVVNKDFLKFDVPSLFKGKFAIIGNYPYNISSQIVFKVLEHRDLIPEMSGMFQKEVAERICEKPGTKTYGILSVLTQAYYKAEYLFTVSENVFNPPPKVKSGVLRLTRLEKDPDCDAKDLFRIVKAAFNQRRKTLRNSLKAEFDKEFLQNEVFNLRPEQLTVDGFIKLARSKKG